MQYSTFLGLLDAGLFAGLVSMGLGYLFRPRIRHGLVMCGYVVYALYWGFWSVLYLTWEKNPTNAIFTVMGIGVFGYLAYHEYINHKRHEYLTAMHWAAKGTALTAFLYLMIERVQIVGGYIVYVTAWQTMKIMNWMGYEPKGVPIDLGTIIYKADVGPSVPLNGSGIAIILACTGIQAMILFAVFNIFLKADARRKFYGFLITVPVIYVANQFRNIAIIFLTERNITLGITDKAFDFAHNWVGKGFSFLVLIGIVIYTFKLLPEALDNLFTLFDLHKRDKGKIIKGELVLPKKDEPTKDKDGKDENGKEEPTLDEAGTVEDEKEEPTEDMAAK